MLILGINGSPRADGATGVAIQRALDAAMAVDAGIQARRIDLADYRISGCITCDGCSDYGRCGINDDFNLVLPLLTDPDVAGIIMAAPTYLGSMAAQGKAFLDRSMLLKRNNHPWRDKIGGAIAIGGQHGGGQEQTLQVIHTAMLCHGMLLCTALEDDCYPGCVLRNRGDEGLDDADLARTERLGQRVAETVLRLS